MASLYFNRIHLIRDGMAHYNGSTSANGVYAYTLDATFDDGTKTTKRGDITLIR